MKITTVFQIKVLTEYMQQKLSTANDSTVEIIKKIH